MKTTVNVIVLLMTMANVSTVENEPQHKHEQLIRETIRELARKYLSDGSEPSNSDIENIRTVHSNSTLISKNILHDQLERDKEYGKISEKNTDSSQTIKEDVAFVHRSKRSNCPGGLGNYGFNSYNLLTFALQVFNGVVNTLNNINNNNNNDNLNVGNNANSNYNEQSSSTNSMSMLVIVVPPAGRKRRAVWEENKENVQSSTESSFEIHQVIKDTYSTISEMVKKVDIDPECLRYTLCLNLQNSYSRYGLNILSEMANNEDIWNNIAQPLLNSKDCTALFPDCL